MRPTLPANLSQPCPPVSHVNSESWDDLALAHFDWCWLFCTYISGKLDVNDVAAANRGASLCYDELIF